MANPKDLIYYLKDLASGTWLRAKKNRMSPDNRFSKTNYLKTNLLKQIKKISL